MKEKNKVVHHRHSEPDDKKKTPLKRWQKVLLIAGSLLLVVALVLGLFYLTKLNKIHFVEDSSIVIDTEMELELDPDDLGDDDVTGELVPAEKPEGDIFQDKDIVNILILGTDERTEGFSDNARADSIMLLSLNKSTRAVKLVSFQRGTAVPIEGRADDWLTHTFRYGGANLTVQTVEECFLIEIDGHVRVNFTAFEKLIDAAGGVEITLTALEAQALNGEVYTNAETKATVSEGANMLSGYDALQYSRLRFIDTDWMRIERQRTVVKSAFSNLKTLSLLELNALLDETLPLVQTNLTRGEITSLMWYAPGFLSSEIEDMSLPERGSYYGAVAPNGQVLNITDFEYNSKILHDFLAS